MKPRSKSPAPVNKEVIFMILNFQKIFFIFILFFLAVSAKSNAEIVNRVEVKGNERITLETIVIFGDMLKKEFMEQCLIF